MKAFKSLSNSQKRDSGPHIEKESCQLLLARALQSKFNGRIATPIDQDDKAGEIPSGNVINAYYKDKALQYFLKAALDNNILLNHLTNHQKLEIVACLKEGFCTNGTVLIKEGDFGYFFTIVEYGEFMFSKDDNELGSCGTADSFGELSILFNSPTMVSVTATTYCKTWRIDKSIFLKIAEENQIDIDKRKVDGIFNFALSAEMSETKVTEMLHDALFVSLKHNDVIYEDGDEGSLFYIILSGEVEIETVRHSEHATEQKVILLSAGSFFGYSDLINDHERTENATVVSHCDLLVFDKILFHEYFDEHLDFFKH